MRNLFRLSLFVALASAAFAGAALRIGTLNAYLDFDPRIEHVGKVDNESTMTAEQYQTKTANLASMIQGLAFVGLQELGGQSEIDALAAASGKHAAFAKGRDTATGEEVGALYDLPGWRVTVIGRVASLDRKLSKHLLVTATDAQGHKIEFLVVHLIRPIGTQAAKHAAQLEAVAEWAQAEVATGPKVSVVVLGDMNHALFVAGSSLFGVGQEAGDLLGFPATHLTKKPFDRIVLIGPGRFTSAEVTKPPYGVRPPAPAKRVWTDHFLLSALLDVP